MWKLLVRGLQPVLPIAGLRSNVTMIGTRTAGPLVEYGAMRESVGIESRVRNVLGDVLLDANASTIPPNLPLWELLDIDASDFRDFATRLSQAFEVDIPEQDYDQLSTLTGCSVYIAKALAARARA